MSDQNSNPGVSQVKGFDPFPEPHTFPSGWNLSGLYAEPRPDPVIEQDQSTTYETGDHPGVSITSSSAEK
jgi:hypothetical protein